MESTEKMCCIVTLSESFSDQKPVSCSGVILNTHTGLLLCNGICFSRFMNVKDALPPEHRFLLPECFSSKLKIRLKFHQQQNLDTNQCAYKSCTVMESNSPSQCQHQTTAQLLLLVNCIEFRRAFEKMFKASDKWDFYGGEEDTEIVRDTEFLSWFALLKVPALARVSNINSGTTPWVASSTLMKGCEVLACGSPFGTFCPDLFMSTLSKGIISNLAGEDNALLFTDARCLPGTEGGGLFVPNEGQTHLVGVIVSPLCWKASEWIGLTLVCSFQVILRNIIWCVNIQNSHKEIHHVQELTDSFQVVQHKTETQKYPTVALVDAGQFWGSGILVSPLLVVTCRHVVNGKRVVALRFNTNDSIHVVKGDVLFSTKLSSPYDVAVVQLRNPPLKGVVSRLAKCFIPGEDVVVVGYGAFGQRCGPSLTSGILSRAIRCRGQPIMLQTTAAVHAGTSGGAVVAAGSGEVLGLVSSNTRDFAAKVTYPHLNFSVPMTVLEPLLQSYTQNGEIGVFQALDTTDEEVQRVWRLQAAHSKL
ncbi:peroxisomal leader peptide-processing protease isoform X2 [Esox lucius]|uniref:Peroxisomal leader peptide-processing protease n=2 Tax=Esox lucius TaxID=8010 RepID=A0A3P8ZA58_ESOLU|nr:peroxisomal leader peptide-processing protease isoform X2 [Esox lucius]